LGHPKPIESATGIRRVPVAPEPEQSRMHFEWAPEQLSGTFEQLWLQSNESTQAWKGRLLSKSECLAKPLQLNRELHRNLTIPRIQKLRPSMWLTVLASSYPRKKLQIEREKENWQKEKTTWLST